MTKLNPIPEENVERMFRALHACAYRAYSLSLCNVTRGQEEFERFNSPKEGDLVLEITAGVMRPALSSIGVLEKIEECPGDTIYHLRLLNGDAFSWGNAKFIKIPETPWEKT